MLESACRIEKCRLQTFERLDKFNVREIIRMIGKLGGFLGRNSDAEAGITVIWRGLEQTSDHVRVFFKG